MPTATTIAASLLAAALLPAGGAGPLEVAAAAGQQVAARATAVSSSKAVSSTPPFRAPSGHTTTVEEALSAMPWFRPYEAVALSVSSSAPLRTKSIALSFTGTAENSTLRWWNKYSYLEDIGDGAGYTGGIIGFTTSTGSMLSLVEHCNKVQPNNVLTKWTKPLQALMALPYAQRAAAAHKTLGPAFEADWAAATKTSWMQQAQAYKRDATYYDPAVAKAKLDGLGPVGQMVYYDTSVQHGQGGLDRFIREAKAQAKAPAEGGSQTVYLNRLLDARHAYLMGRGYGGPYDRTQALKGLVAQNSPLKSPLTWNVYGDNFMLLAP